MHLKIGLSALFTKYVENIDKSELRNLELKALIFSGNSFILSDANKDRTAILMRKHYKTSSTTTTTTTTTTTKQTKQTHKIK